MFFTFMVAVTKFNKVASKQTLSPFLEKINARR